MLLDIASFGANSYVVSRFTHVRPQWKVSHHVALAGHGTITDGNRKYAVRKIYR